MNKTLKTLLIVALSLIAAGIIFIVVGFALTGFNFGTINSVPTRVQQNYDYEADGIKSLEISDTNTGIILSASNDGKFHITCYESESEYYRIDNGNGVLSITFVSDLKWYEHFFRNFFDNHKDIRVSVPAGIVLDIDAETKNGSVSAENLKTGVMTLVSSNGRIDVKDCDTDGKLIVKSQNGSLDIDTVTAGSAECETSNGRIDLKNAKTDGVLTLSTSNGGVKADRSDAGGEFRISTSNGSIKVSGVSSKEGIYLKTSNGSVNGSVAGSFTDYTIRSRTSLGHSNLPDKRQGGAIILDVTTSTGSIDIEFEED